MKNIFKVLKDSMEAAAFAEAGEFETARSMAASGKKEEQKVVDIKKTMAGSLSRLDTIEEAITFAEAGEIDTARRIMKQLKGRSSVKKVHAGSEKQAPLSVLDKMSEAVTFAEAGEQEYARELIGKKETKRQKILVVGGDDGFSETLMNYAVGMAGRMNYEIVALSVIPVGKRILNLLNEKKVAAELKTQTHQMAEAFRAKAEGKKIPFTHIVKFGPFDRVVKETHKEVKRIAFVLAEPDQVCDGATGSVPVFCLASGE